MGIESESLLSLAQATQRIPGRPSLRTVWRWVHSGVGGHRLETIKSGGRRFTSAEAIARFNSRCTNATAICPSDHTRRDRDILRAEAELAEAGL